jgi:bifunctional N-acetylglucosamine-1-phosphate-uridyltransferase/glucosamine-1-phosphate-acetyltransferase GlmU-like protein
MVETMLDPMSFKTEEEDVFVLVLKPSNHSTEKYLNVDINGRTSIEWVKKAVSKWHHRFVETTDKEDILSVFRKNITPSKWTVILYADTPLLTTASVEGLISYAIAKSAKVVKAGRGFIFDTSYVKASDTFDVYEYTLGDPDDYIIAWNQNQIDRIIKIMKERKGEPKVTKQEVAKEPVISTTPLATKDYYIDASSQIGKNCKILKGTIIENSIIGDNCTIGPYAHLRPGNKIGNNVKIGNFVEVKNSIIGDRTKVAHMSYIGDGVVGKDCNVGCGVIFCNYNEKREKHTTTIGDNVFIGSNTNFIAPISVGNNSTIGAGSTIYENVPDNSFAIARAKQYTKPIDEPTL